MKSCHTWHIKIFRGNGVFESHLGTNTRCFALVRHIWDTGQLGRFRGHILKFINFVFRKERKESFWGRSLYMEDIEYNTLKQFHVLLYAHNNVATCITEISVRVFSCTCFLSPALLFSQTVHFSLPSVLDRRYDMHGCLH